MRRSAAAGAGRPRVRRGERHPDDRARGAGGRREPDGGGDRPPHRVDAPRRRGRGRRGHRGGRGRGHVPRAGAGRDARAPARPAHGAVRRPEPALPVHRQRRDHGPGHAGRAVAARAASPHRPRPVPGSAALRRQPVDERGARHHPRAGRAARARVQRAGLRPRGGARGAGPRRLRRGGGDRQRGRPAVRRPRARRRRAAPRPRVGAGLDRPPRQHHRGPRAGRPASRRRGRALRGR